MAVTTTWRTAGTSAAKRAVAEAGVASLAAEAPDHEALEVIFTDRFDQVVGELAPLERMQNRVEQTPAYSARRVDGARAVAKTMDMSDGRIVIVAGVELLRNAAVMRRTMVHQAQHVRLIKNGDSACAVHRRTSFDLPDDLVWEYLWLAESALDECRCEWSVYERGLDAVDPTRGSTPSDYRAIVAAFSQARLPFERQDDLMGSYQAAFAALDRLTMYLAYGAATLVAGSPVDWSGVPGMVPVLTVLREIPETRQHIGTADLLGSAVALARVTRGLFQQARFDCWHDPDGSTQFYLLG